MTPTTTAQRSSTILVGLAEVARAWTRSAMHERCSCSTWWRGDLFTGDSG